MVDSHPDFSYNRAVQAIDVALNVPWNQPGTSEGGKYRVSEVHVREGESLENALKRFKRSCAKSGVLAEVRKREFYDSPSVKRRKKSEAARKNRKKFY